MGLIRKLLALLLVLAPGIAFPSDLTVPNEFVGGTTAEASEVNANFDAVETAIDDNDSRIDELVSDEGFRPVYLVEDYGTGLAGINAALAACDTAADAATSLPGIVMLPRGGTTIVVTGSDESPLIDMPETANGDDNNRYASCELRGWGMTPQQAFGNPSSGSFLYFYNPDAMTADGDGRRVLIQFGGYGQQFSDFGLGISGDAATSYDGTTAMFGCSTARGAFAACEYGVKAWDVDRVSLGAAATSGNGVGIETIFGLDGAIRDSWISNFTTGYLPTHMDGTANNTVMLENNRFSGNDDAILIDGTLACQDMYLFENTIESNVNGVHLTNDATCHVTMIGNHFEQDSAGTQAGARDVWVEGTAGSVTIVGGAMMGDITDANHIVIAAAQASADTPTHIVQGVRFIDHDQTNYTVASGARFVIDGDYSRSTVLVPTASANDSDTSAASTAFVQQEINGAGGTDLTCSSGSCDVDSTVTRNADLAAYTTGTSTPTDGSTACNTGDMHLETDAFKIYFCVDGATDDWYGVALTDSP